MILCIILIAGEISIQTIAVGYIIDQTIAVGYVIDVQMSLLNDYPRSRYTQANLNKSNRRMYQTS